MLVRAFAAALALITLVFATTFSSPVSAQSERNKEIAREKFTKGVTAYDAGEYEKARTLFLQAYALTRHPLLLLNLGLSEVKGGHHEEGGNHLQQFLREHDTPTDQQQKDAESGISDAQRKTGYVILIVDTDGAELAIDGTTIGKSPLVDPYFVAPGKHVASAKKGGKSTQTEIDVQRGTATPVTLNIGGGGLTPVPGPVPTPTPTTVPSPTPYTAPMPPPEPFPQPIAPAPMPYQGMPPGGDTGREDLMPWFRRKPGAWALFGVAGAGLIGTIVFGALAGNRNSNAGSFSDQILAEVQAGENGKSVAKLPPQYWSEGNGTGTPQPCGTLDDPSTAFGHYQTACNDLRNEINAYDDLLIGVAVSVPIFVGATAGLIIYYFVDTGGKKGANNTGITIMPTPIITPETRGGGLVGTF